MHYNRLTQATDKNILLECNTSQYNGFAFVFLFAVVVAVSFFSYHIIHNNNNSKRKIDFCCALCDVRCVWFELI